MGGGAPEVGVEAAAVAVVAGFGFPDALGLREGEDAVGLRGKTLGPPILGFNKPLAERATSRTISASSRRRF